MLTLTQTYYAINAALNNYLTTNQVKAQVYKYGIDPALLKTNVHNRTSGPAYPYFQSYITNPKQNTWTTVESGIFTDYEYQLSFFTAPTDEFVNDSAYFWPFEVAKNALSDRRANLLDGIAVIKSSTGHYEFAMKSGQPVPAAFQIYQMRSVCAYADLSMFPTPGNATNLDNAVTVVGTP